MEHALFLFLVYVFLGAFAGLAFGLFGVGGGLIVVPGLAWLFRLQHFSPENVMHMAVGTSLAIMIVSTLRAIYSHHQFKTKFWDLFYQLLPGVIVGAIGGAVLGHFLHSHVIAVIFGVTVLLIAIRLLFMKAIDSQRQLPRAFGMGVVGVITGVVSGLLGLGGGVVTIPYLTYCNVSMRKAIMVSIATALTVSMVGSVTVMVTGSFAAGLPHWSTGYIYWPAWLGVSIGTLFIVPVGVALSYRLPVPLLKRAFAIFLLLIGIHLLIGH